jgi:hypothetical protein
MSKASTSFKTIVEEEKQAPKRLKDVRFGLLFDASDHIADEYWKNVVVDLSRGRCPKKVTIDHQTIYAGNKRNQLSYFYGNKTPQQIADELPPLLRSQLSIYSANDIKQNSEETDDQFNEFINRVAENCWKRIKNKKMRHTLLVDYVLYKKDEWELSIHQARQLLSTIENALFVFRTHSSNDIHMEDGNISNIDDIVYQHKEIRNLRYNQFIFESDDEEEEDNSGTINDVWVNYVKGLVDEL